jgi:hypothetical protein
VLRSSRWPFDAPGHPDGIQQRVESLIDRVWREIVDHRAQFAVPAKPANQSVRCGDDRPPCAIRLHQHAAHAVVSFIAEPDDVAGREEILFGVAVDEAVEHHGLGAQLRERVAQRRSCVLLLGAGDHQRRCVLSRSQRLDELEDAFAFADRAVHQHILPVAWQTEPLAGEPRVAWHGIRGGVGEILHRRSAGFRMARAPVGERRVDGQQGFQAACPHCAAK